MDRELPRKTAQVKHSAQSAYKGCIGRIVGKNKKHVQLVFETGRFASIPLWFEKTELNLNYEILSDT